MRIVNPRVPEGYVPVETQTRFLPWSVVKSDLEASIHYWLASTYPDGRPHVVPRWGLWLDSQFWYDGSPETRHALNLERNSACALHLESGKRAVIVSGHSQPSDPVGAPFGARLSHEFGRKYGPLGYNPPPDSWSDPTAGGLRRFVPINAIAWTEFPLDLTKFEFDT